MIALVTTAILTRLDMLTRNVQLLIFSTLVAGGVGQALASPVLYAWAGNAAGAKGGSTYVIDPVAGTVVMLRGAGDGIGSGSGTGASSGGGGGGSGTGSGAGASDDGARSSGASLSPGAMFSASSQALTFAGPYVNERERPDGCGPEQRIWATEKSAAEHAEVDGLSMLSVCRNQQRHTGLTRPSGAPEDYRREPPELTPSEAPFFISPSANVNGPAATIAAVPEPSSLALLGGALAVFGVVVRRRKR